ncbi:MAG: TIGR04282 family arsenosugar biosynthesis glycosyltransferase [Nitrospira sp.]|nr:TIGR04282 family arsenosugar biosynthesis glycosyltransferase [Nitrospira sp.]
MKKALITFAKAPIPGTVKTRLQADIGPKRAVKIYRSFVTGVLTECSRLKGIDRFLGCTPTQEDGYLSDLAAEYKLRTFDQEGKTLGRRIYNAFKHCSEMGYSDIVLIGSDSPSIPADFIKTAFNELKKNDFVIGPCFDNGLYLIGAKSTRVDEIFRTIKIDTGKDVNGILKKIEKTKIKLSMLPFWYDIDDIEDLEFLKAHLKYLKKDLL